jgi:hypothetical protein
MLMLGLVRKSTLLDDDPRCTCKSRTPRPALTAPRHDVTSAALSGLAAQKHEQGFGATSTQPVCMLDDATVHIEDAASCAYRYTTATRLDMYSTMHRCVEWPCFTEAKYVPPSRDYTEEVGKGRERGRDYRERTFRRKCRLNADRPAATARTSRAARATAVVPVETASWAPIALTVLGGQAVVMLQER